MTVAELIKVLQDYEQESQVVLYGRVKSMVATDVHVVDAVVTGAEEFDDLVIIKF